MRLITLVLTVVTTITGCAVHFQRPESDAVYFYLRSPQAHKVQIAASYNGFALQSAQRLDSGTWVAKLPQNISFSYFYIVDGQPYFPPCDLTENDDFGQANCIYAPPM